MRRTIYFLLGILAAIALTACAGAPATPSVEMVQTAIAHTQAAQPPAETGGDQTAEQEAELPAASATPAPTDTPEPTSTPTPTETPQPTRSTAELQEALLESIITTLESGQLMEDVEVVTLARFTDAGVLEIEMRTIWASQDYQPHVTFDTITWLAELLGELSADEARYLAGGNDLVIHITTYSTNGEYRYQSETTFETLVNLAKRAISYDEWVIASNAGFR